MPEAPEVFSFLRKVQRVIEKEKTMSAGPAGAAQTEPEARLVMFPRVFAVGTQSKAYSSISLDDSRFDHTLEPAGVIPDICSHWDLVKAKSNSCTYLVDRALAPGPLLAAIRGKCLVLAAGHHAITISFGLEACLYVVSLSDFYAILQGDCPGPNEDTDKAAELRSFKLPPHLIEPGSEVGGIGHCVNIFCAFLMKQHAVILTDFSRLVRLRVISRSAPWMAKDLEVGTEWWENVLWREFPDGPDWLRLSGGRVVTRRP